MTTRNRKNRSRAWFFTWNNPDVGFRAQIENTLDGNDYVFQLERGENGTRHVQGVMRYNNPRERWPDIDCHWERCRNWRAAVKYCSKVKTRIDGPWTNINGLTWRRTIRDPLYGFELYDWQMKVLDIINGDVDDRKIYWFWDSEGCKGKSTLAKHIVMNYKAICVGGQSRDALCAIKLRLEENDIDVVVFDVPRSDFNSISYRTMEYLKNGMFFSGKYEPMDVLMNPPHMLVFANFPPDLNKMSNDRWEVVELA